MLFFVLFYVKDVLCFYVKTEKYKERKMQKTKNKQSIKVVEVDETISRSSGFGFARFTLFLQVYVGHKMDTKM